MFTGFWLLLYFFHVAFFSCCSFQYWKILKMNKRQKMQPKNDLTLNTLNLFTFILISYNTFLPLYNFERLIKWNRTNTLFCWKRICLPRIENLKTRMSVGIYFSPTSNKWYWEWMDSEKIYSRWKNTRVGITLFGIIKSQL